MDLIKGVAAGSIAACGAVTFTNPWEVVKTRLQLQNELSTQKAKVYPSAVNAIINIYKREGIRGIQKGLLPAYGYQMLLNGTRLGLYDPLKVAITTQLPSLPFASMVLSGALSGVLGALLASPLFLIKTRMQSHTTSSIKVGHQHDYITKGALHSLRHVYNSEGVSGLWRGVDAAMLRTGVGSAVQLSTYDTIKKGLVDNGFFEENGGIPLHFSSSLLTSFFVCLAMNPFDVASTRMYNQQSNANHKGGALYKNGIDCLIKTVKVEGFPALYKGFSAHYLRIGPHTIFTFVFLEQVKKLLDVV